MSNAPTTPPRGMRGATSVADGASGYAPKPLAGDQLKTLRGDGTYQLSAEGGLTYKGTWNASTNTPTLADGTGTAGDAYNVQTAASRNLGSGSITYAINDWVVYNGSIWQKRLNAERVGTTTLAAISAAGNTDVTITAGVRHQTVLAPVSAGSAAYAATISLLATNAVAGSRCTVRVAIAASTNPAITIRDLTSGGTVQLAVQGGAVVRTYWVECVFDGTNWAPLASGCQRAASIDEVNDLRNALAPQGALALDGTSANTAAAADSTALAYATDDFSGVVKDQLPTYTPAAEITLLEKAASNLGWQFRLSTGGLLKLRIGNGSNFTTYSYSSTVAVSSGAYKTAIFAFTADRDGNVVFYENGVALGAAVSIAASSAQTITSTGPLRIGYDGTTSATGKWYSWTTYNLALTQADITEIYELGGAVPERFKFGSQASIAAGSFVSGKIYRITAIGSTDFTGIGAASNTVGLTFAATGVGSGTGTAVRAGAVAHYDADLDGIGYQLHDQSTNKLDAVITTTGVSWTKPARSGYLRGTLTWAGTHENKSILGQRALPNEAVIILATLKSTAASTGSGASLQDGFNSARFAAVQAITTAKKNLTLANGGLPGGTTDTDCNLGVDPDTNNFTGSIQVDVRYTVTEGNP